MPAREFLEALQDINNLKLDDLEYVRAHGYYKSVKKWAKKQMSEIVDEADEAKDDESTEDETAASA